MKFPSFSNLAFVLFLLISQSFSNEVYVIRILNPTEQFISKCITEKKFISSLERGDHIDLVVRDDEYKALSEQYASIEVLETFAPKKQQLSKTTEGTQDYHTYTEMVDELKALEKDYPEQCKVYDIGDSRGKSYSESAYSGYKHDIWAVKVSDSVDKNEDEPRFLYMANMHGWEIASLEVCLAVLNYYLKNYNTNDEITKLVNNTEIWFVPLVNPDGHKVPQRKNINDNNNSHAFEQYSDGVDLNRNFAFNWGQGAANHEKSDDDYCGPAAGSEPETEAIMKLFEEKRFVADISYHLYSELVIWPYAYETKAIAPDDSALSDLGKLIASKLVSNSNPSKTYKPMKITGLYPAAGSKEDFAYARFGTFSYCIELYDRGFSPSVQDMRKLCEDNPDAALELVKRVTYATLTGNVTVQSTKKPVEATVFIKEIDDTVVTRKAWRAPYKSNGAFGRYYRMLMPGKYTVTFSAPGCKDTTINEVVIKKDGVTKLDIVLSDLSTYAFLKKSFGPEVTVTKCMRSDVVNITVPDVANFLKIEIFNTHGQLIKRFNYNQIDNNVASLQTRDLSNGMYYIKVMSKTETESAQFSLSR